MLNIDLKLSRLAYFFIAGLCLSYYYLGEMRVVVLSAYIVGILYLLNALKLTRADILILSILTYSVVYNLLTYVNIAVLLFTLRLNLGFLVFYYFFRSIKRPSIESLTIFLSLATIFEYILIRILPALVDVLPNYADLTFHVTRTESIVGGVNSFGGNRTVSSIILLSLFAYLENINAKRRFRYLPLIASVLCFSGAGVTLTFVYFIWKYRKKLVLVPIMVVIVSILLLNTDGGTYSWDKFTIEYLFFIYNYKVEQILHTVDMMDGKVINYIFGIGDSAFSSYEGEIAGYGSTFGDFLMLDFFTRFGILGMAIIVGVIIASANKKTILPMLIMFAGTFHYHVIFSVIGQFIFGYLLASGSAGAVNQQSQRTAEDQ